MKKTLMGLVILGGIAASVAYKLKKDEQEKELLDLEIELLEKEIEEGHRECLAQAASLETDDDKEVFDCEQEATYENKPEEMVEESSNVEEYPNIDEQTKETIDRLNEDVFTSLENNGDKAGEERPIQHFVEFENEEDLHSFKKAVIEKGYVVTHGDGPYDLSVLHIAPLDRSQLVTHIYYLANQAMQNNGKYKGWNSRVSY